MDSVMIKKIGDMFRRAHNRTFRGFEKESNLVWKGPFRFIQAADPQFGLIDEFKYVNWDGPIDKAIRQSIEYKSRGAAVWDDEINLCKLAIEQWNRMIPKPKFVVVCGDLVNDFPGERQRSDQLNDFIETFSKIDQSIPLVLLPGNHDLLNQPTPKTVADYCSKFGDDYFSFWVDGVMFMVINVQYYKDSTKTQQLAKEHDYWIDCQLKDIRNEKNNYKHVIVFQHIPWFTHHIDEPDDSIFNIAMEERKRMIKKFSSNGIRAIFAGHYHRNSCGRYEDLEIVVTSAMGAQIGNSGDKSGYRIVDVDVDSIKHQYVSIE
ncbi:hypothetical protein RDWZM_006230 [Blomia tropicalis]|uniref:Calcineurin-like phosphoesterase domain-containing protein n=1 Tax=Blomia tropicalis TaxID=40697 RepID=A0A9Q0RLK2_BLOTA|nr:hypothetical protein RDWZM_006230 [Blomia tropicalis]